MVVLLLALPKALQAQHERLVHLLDDLALAADHPCTSANVNLSNHACVECSEDFELVKSGVKLSLLGIPHEKLHFELISGLLDLLLSVLLGPLLLMGVLLLQILWVEFPLPSS